MGRKNSRSRKASLRIKSMKDERGHEALTFSDERREVTENIKLIDKDKGVDGNEYAHDQSQRQEISIPQFRETDVIGVEPRLIYPLVRASLAKDSSVEEEEEEEEEEDEESIELNVKPRFVFVSSLCAVCLKKSQVFCERCQMVSYCSEDHRSHGLLEHGDICDGLREIRRSIATSLSDESIERLDAEQYRVYRLRLLGILESKIDRPLRFWEREIVLYPRVCRICRRYREHPTCCAYCAMEYFCEDHGEQHQRWCREFRVLRRCLFLQYRHGCVYPTIPNVRREICVASPDVDFDRLMHRIYQNSPYYREMDCYTYSILSHQSTIPLTVLYSMQTCCSEWSSKTDWTIHVLGAEFQFEGINLAVWEKLFLHFLPNLKRLRLLLVGPELRLPSNVPTRLLSKVKLCSGCKSAGRTVDVLFRPERLYHELVRDEPGPGRVAEPDLICLFNPGLYRKTGFAGKDTWLDTIREFARVSIPVVVTSYTKEEIFWEITRINSLIQVNVLLEPRRNPFASIKPDRNFVTDHTNPLIYKNYYITIVQAKPTLP
ncbi:uncharacterized protein LOC143373227 [Andrena cerasifolii]|uniref:uncharacterized protein LOC143373227 n=1 Tax=Andrena cerasifolii TaxID=2819439 RepID=UPI0040381B63